MIENKIGESIYYTFDKIDSSRVQHLFSSRIGWEGENRLINQIFKSDKKVISLRQVHGDQVEIIDRRFVDNWKEGRLVDGDGLLTDRDDLILKTYHADCTPLYFIDYSKNVVGLAHAGWKGTFKNIMGRMLDKMQSVYGCNKSNIWVYIGPAIKSCCYEVGEDLYKDFSLSYGNYREAFSARCGKYYLDSQIINFNQALDCGLDKSKVYLEPMCTSCNVDKLYSYRRENGTKGRLITAISIKK